MQNTWYLVPYYRLKQRLAIFGQYYLFSFLIFKNKGWDWYQLIKFIKTEKPDEYDKIISSIKQYADCLEMTLIPI
jgi:hypothetical protein